ncbi:MAG: APC family permease [Nitrospirota bacterium]
MLRILKRVFIGKPIETERALEERLTKRLALPIFASDAISSTAYATEEILLVLMLAGSLALSYSIPIACAISILLAIVTISYLQTIMAYPSGGGAYIVARENLGIFAGQVAGAALMIDYVLTVSVSMSAGVAAITSAFPSLYSHRVMICLIMIVFVTLMNLRGTKESGVLFAIPSYGFIFSFGILMLYGLFLSIGRPDVQGVPIEATQSLTLLLLLKAFASGCAALTGVEAISNGVKAFQPPESKNACITMVWMSCILVSLFLGVTWLSHHFAIVPSHDETVISKLTRALTGTGWFYYLIQFVTALILILAANTGFAGFPRLSALQAEGGFLPKQFARIGDRLVYSNGIIVLAIASSLLVILFDANTHALVPLYALGVFLSFTLSQWGMVCRGLRLRVPGWQRSITINAIGAMTTAVVFFVITVAKFSQGAWIILIVLPAITFLLFKIHRHYTALSQLQKRTAPAAAAPSNHVLILLVPGMNQAVMTALEYAKIIQADIRALHIELSPEDSRTLKLQWEQWAGDMPLVIMESPFRSLTSPLIRYLKEVEAEKDSPKVTVMIPEVVVSGWLNNLLHNQTGLLLKWALLFHPDVVVINLRTPMATAQTETI